MTKALRKLRERMTRLNMSARAFDRILRVARTIADLDYASAANWDLTPPEKRRNSPALPSKAGI